MQRIALLTLALMLSGCGYKTWWNPPFTGGYNPNLPIGDSENMRRVQGLQTSLPPLPTEPGDIWPGPLPPPPTLKDLEATGGLTSQPEAPVVGSPLNRGTGAPYPAPSPSIGSSTPQMNPPPGLPAPQSAPPLSSYAAPPAAPPAHPPAGGWATDAAVNLNDAPCRPPHFWKCSAGGQSRPWRAPHSKGKSVWR